MASPQKLLLGSVPPPLGGVSVYCQRKIELEKKQGFSVFFYNSKSYTDYIRLVLKIWYLKNKNIDYEFEVNITNPYVLFFIAFFGAASGSVFFDHNASRNYRTFLKKMMFYFYLSKVSSVKLVNEDIKKNYPAKLSKNFNFKVVSPYVRPSKSEVEAARMNMPERLKKETGSTRNIILNTAWKPIDTVSEPDLYGLLLTLDLYAVLCPQFEKYKFALIIGSTDESSYCKNIIAKAEALLQYENFMLVTEGFNQLGVLDSTKIYLRLTKTDGDSLSVREALDFGCTVIASDVVARPEGVINVKLDYNDVLQTIIDQLNKNTPTNA